MNPVLWPVEIELMVTRLVDFGHATSVDGRFSVEMVEGAPLLTSEEPEEAHRFVLSEILRVIESRG